MSLAEGLPWVAHGGLLVDDGQFQRWGHRFGVLSAAGTSPSDGKDGGGGIEMRDEPRHREPDLAVGVDGRAILSYMVGVSS